MALDYASNISSSLPLLPSPIKKKSQKRFSNSFVNVLTDFLTIIKYRKKGINKILG